jgi:hypothetical protein
VFFIILVVTIILVIALFIVAYVFIGVFNLVMLLFIAFGFGALQLTGFNWDYAPGYSWVKNTKGMLF